LLSHRHSATPISKPRRLLIAPHSLGQARERGTEAPLPFRATPDTLQTALHDSTEPAGARSGSSAEYTPGRARRQLRVPAQWLNGFCNDWLLWGYKRTFSPFHRGVVTAYALEVGAAGQGDNRDPSFSAFEAVRYPIHETLPIFFTHNSEL
jgi:hypothetical protein